MFLVESRDELGSVGEETDGFGGDLVRGAFVTLPANGVAKSSVLVAFVKGAVEDLGDFVFVFAIDDDGRWGFFDTVRDGVRSVGLEE